MHIRCPHCQNTLDVVDDSTLCAHQLCPECGSGFSLVEDPSTEFEVGAPRPFGHLVLLEMIGSGAMGTVWKAMDERLDRIVAVKIPRKGQLSPREREQFLREARAAAQMQHVHIVGVHEVGVIDDQVYIVSDFVEGETLADRMADLDRRLSHREAAALCATIASALHEAHEKSIVHRDLKPLNIMLTHDGEPRIMDFGLAKRDIGEVTMTVDGHVLGTPAYMSPEQARGAAHEADRRSDVYSLGVILYEMLTGERPFRGTGQRLLEQVIGAEAPPPRKLNDAISRDLDTICVKCLQKEPHARYATAEALAEDLNRFLEGVPVLARPVGPVTRGWRWCRRNTRVALLSALAAGFLLVALVATTVGLWTSRAALRRESAALREARVLEERAEQARSRAESAYRQARAAVDEYYVTVSEETLLQMPGMQPLRRTLLESALHYYESFIDGRADDPDLMAELADARSRVALITAQLGSPVEAIEHYREAIAIQERLLDESPGEHALEIALAQNCNDLGLLLRAARELDEASVMLTRALELRRTLCRVAPDVERDRELAATLNNQGLLHQSRREWDLATEAYVEAVELIQAQVMPGEMPVASAALLARSYRNWGTLEFRKGERERSLELYLEALRLQRALVESSPAVLTYEVGLMSTCTNLGNVQNSLGHRDDAIESYTEAIRIGERVVEANPQVADYQSRLATSYTNLGNAQRAAGQTSSAALSFQAARTRLEALVERIPASEQYRSELATTCLSLASLQREEGDPEGAAAAYGRAAELLEALQQEHPEAVSIARSLAQTYLGSAALAQEREDHPAALNAFSRAVEILEPLVGGARPGNTNVLLRNAHWGRAQTLDALGDHEASIPSWEAAVALSSARIQPSLRRYLALALARCDRHRLAIEQAEPLLEAAAADGVLAFDLARLYALAAGAVARDGAMAEGLRCRQRDDCLEESVRLLEVARDTGYFQSVIRLSHLDEEPDLDDLRDFPPFDALRQELWNAMGAATDVTVAQ